MIFLTVGYMMPFDRLVRLVDEWAGRNPDVEFFAQIGPTDYRPANLPYVQFVNPKEYMEKVSSCELMIAHAGTGTIVTAMQYEKPVLVFPRHGALRETTDDHQITYAGRLKDLGGVKVAMDETELNEWLDRLEELTAGDALGSAADDALISRLGHFIQQAVEG